MSFWLRLRLRFISSGRPTHVFPPQRRFCSMAQTSPFTNAVIASMRKLYPEVLADKSWDNTGVLLEAPFHAHHPKKANSVLLTIDLTKAVVDEAIQGNHSVVVAYHPIIFRGLKAITLGDPQQQSLLRLAAHGISVYCPHTAVDAVPGGMADWLCDIITGKLANIDSQPQPGAQGVQGASGGDPRSSSKLSRPPGSQPSYSKPNYVPSSSAIFHPDVIAHTRSVITPSPASSIESANAAHRTGPPPYSSSNTGAGRVVTFEEGQSLGLLISRIAAAVGHPKAFPLAIPQGANIEDISVRTVGLCPGSGSSVVRAAYPAPDLVFTGEVSHHDALAIIERGGCIISLFHSNSERGYLDAVMKPLLEAELKREWKRMQGSSNEKIAVMVSHWDRDPFGIVVLEDEEDMEFDPTEEQRHGEDIQKAVAPVSSALVAEKSADKEAAALDPAAVKAQEPPAQTPPETTTTPASAPAPIPEPVSAPEIVSEPTPGPAAAESANTSELPKETSAVETSHGDSHATEQQSEKVATEDVPTKEITKEISSSVPTGDATEETPQVMPEAIAETKQESPEAQPTPKPPSAETSEQSPPEKTTDSNGEVPKQAAVPESSEPETVDTKQPAASTMEGPKPVDEIPAKEGADKLTGQNVEELKETEQPKTQVSEVDSAKKMPDETAAPAEVAANHEHNELPNSSKQSDKGISHPPAPTPQTAPSEEPKKEAQASPNEAPAQTPAKSSESAVVATIQTKAKEVPAETTKGTEETPPPAKTEPDEQANEASNQAPPAAPSKSRDETSNPERSKSSTKEEEGAAPPDPEKNATEETKLAPASTSKAVTAETPKKLVESDSATSQTAESAPAKIEAPQIPAKTADVPQQEDVKRSAAPKNIDASDAQSTKLQKSGPEETVDTSTSTKQASPVSKQPTSANHKEDASASKTSAAGQAKEQTPAVEAPTVQEPVPAKDVSQSKADLPQPDKDAKEEKLDTTIGNSVELQMADSQAENVKPDETTVKQPKSEQPVAKAEG